MTKSLMDMPLMKVASEIVNRIEALGVRVPPSSRFGRMAKTFARGTVSPDDKDFPIAQEAIRDVRLMGFALDNLSQIVEVELAKKVRRAIKDSPLLEEAGSKSFGRDAQNELYIAAICCNAGMLVSLDEPDIVCRMNDQKWAIAAKRIKSLAQLEKRFCEAAKQIEKKGIPGIIALDMSVAFNPDNSDLPGNYSDQEMASAHSNSRKAFVDHYVNQMRAWSSGKGVCGLMILDHIVRYIPKTGVWGCGGFHYFFPLGSDETQEDIFEEFMKYYHYGIPQFVSTGSRGHEEGGRTGARPPGKVV